MGRKTIFTILFLIESAFVTIIGQDVKFEYITPDDGLSQASVGCLLQDKDGFMWFGTMNGLNKFDGFRFMKYYHNPADSTSVAGNQIDCIFEDSHGELWIGGDGGISVYNRDLDVFKSFRHNDKDTNSLIGHRAFSIFEDSKGRYWVGSMGDGLNLFNGKDNKFTHFIHSESNINSISNNDIRSIIEDNEGNILIATMGGGLNLLNPETKNIIRFLHDENDPKSVSFNDIFSLTKDAHGTIWVGTLGGGLCRMNYSGSGKYSFDNFRPVADDVRRNKILALYADHKDGIWIGTENGGLDYFSIRNKTFVNYRVDENNPNSLNNNSVHAICEDKTGNLWIGTYTGGVNVVKKNKKKLYTYAKIPGNPNSLSYNAVSCFFEDKESNLWIGTDGGGLNIWNRKKNQMIHYNSKNSSLNSDAILAICNDKDDDIWVGGWDCGLNMYNKKNKTFTSYTQEKNGIPNNNIFDILVDHKGRIWVAFGNIGLAKYDKKLHTFVIYSKQNSNLPANWVLNLTEDYAGNIILGLTDGFSIFNPENETFENFQNKENDNNCLSYNQINIIIPGHDSTLWIGTVFGLDNYNPKNKKFTHFFAKDGLPDNNITGLAEDNHGFIWSSTSNGISRYDPRSGSFRNYTVTDGLQGNGYIRNSCYKTSRGEILFGGSNGFNIFYPDSLFDNPNLPRVVLTGFSIFNKPVKAGDLGSPLSKQISQTRQLALSYKQSVISFEFAALEYTSPGQNQYAYRLEGFEKDWNFVGTKHTATYTNLDPGKYILSVKASNNDGKWNNEGVSLHITVKPPFWDTWWFRIIAIFSFCMTLASFFLIRIRNLKTKELYLKQKIAESTNDLKQANLELKERQDEITSQNDELLHHRSHLEHLVEERTIDLELALKKAEDSDKLKSSFLANMSHEIRTPMNAIVGFSSLLKDYTLSEDEKNQYIDIINKNCDSLLVLINDILDISRIEANQISIYPTTFNVDIVLFELERFYKMRVSNNIEIKYIRTIENVIIENDATRFRQVFSNLLTNALKFTESGYIHFGFEKINADLRFYVSDTGIGIEQQEYDNIFNPFTKVEFGRTKLYRGAGLGLSISKNLVEKMGGNIWIESVYGEGSTFYFTLPYNPKASSNSDYDHAEKDFPISDLSKNHILIAEDEPANYLYLEKALKSSNASIHWAKNGLEAVDMVEKAKDFKFDLILMDIKMPVLNGIDAFIEIRKLDKKVPIIAQSAFAQEIDRNQAIQIGFTDYLIKPIRPKVLMEVIGKFI
jgi:signal transduction histidine kinase/ligand-binding sensor domain-containing protein